MDSTAGVDHRGQPNIGRIDGCQTYDPREANMGIKKIAVVVASAAAVAAVGIGATRRRMSLDRASKAENDEEMKQADTTEG